LCLAFNFKNSNIFISFLTLRIIRFCIGCRLCMVEHVNDVNIRYVASHDISHPFYFFPEERIYFTNQHNAMTLLSCNRNEEHYRNWHASDIFNHLITWYIYIYSSSHMHSLIYPTAPPMKIQHICISHIYVPTYIVHSHLGNKIELTFVFVLCTLCCQFLWNISWNA
jgi:hypothetical protein